MLAAFRMRVGRCWPLSARGTFLLLLSGCLAIGTRLWWRDEVANALAVLLGLLLGFQGTLVALARVGLPGWVRLADATPPESRPNAPPERSGWAWARRPWWLRLGLCEPWFLEPAWIDPADGVLRVPCPRRGTYHITPYGSLRDALGLIQWPVRWPDDLSWLVFPPRPQDALPLPTRVSPAGDRWDPEGRPEGDWFDIKPAEPQTPRRLLLWKLSAKTGSEATLRRAPETVGTSEPRTGILLLLSPDDEPAAAVVRAWLEDAEEAWIYADSAAPRSLLVSRDVSPRETLAQLARSGTPPPGPLFPPEDALNAFLEEAATRRFPLSRVLVFAAPSALPVSSTRPDLALAWFQVTAEAETSLEEVSRQGRATVCRLCCRLPGDDLGTTS